MKEPRAACGGIALLTFLLPSPPQIARQKGGGRGAVPKQLLIKSYSCFWSLRSTSKRRKKNVFYLPKGSVQSTAEQKKVYSSGEHFAQATSGFNVLPFFVFFFPKGIVRSTEILPIYYSPLCGLRLW